MKNGIFMLEWNCYRSSIRTNNSWEHRNKEINQRFGPHPHLFDFVWGLSEWFENGFIEYEQYLKHGPGNKKPKRELLREPVLLKWWEFIDEHQKESDILLFLEKTSIAMKANSTVLQKMLREVL